MTANANNNGQPPSPGKNFSSAAEGRPLTEEERQIQERVRARQEERQKAEDARWAAIDEANKGLPRRTGVIDASTNKKTMVSQGQRDIGLKREAIDNGYDPN